MVGFVVLYLVAGALVVWLIEWADGRVGYPGYRWWPSWEEVWQDLVVCVFWLLAVMMVACVYVRGLWAGWRR